MIYTVQQKLVPGIVAIYMYFQAYYLVLQSYVPVRNYYELQPSHIRKNSRSWAFVCKLNTVRTGEADLRF